MEGGKPGMMGDRARESRGNGSGLVGWLEVGPLADLRVRDDRMTNWLPQRKERRGGREGSWIAGWTGRKRISSLVSSLLTSRIMRQDFCSLISILPTPRGRSCRSLSLFRPIFLVSLRSHSSKNFCQSSKKGRRNLRRVKEGV